MTNCCTPGSNFPTASQMEMMATNHPVIWEEICMIQQAILAASSQCQPGGGQMCTVVAGATPMTFVTGLSSVTVVNGGSGYFADTPTVEFIPPLGATVTPAVASVVTNGGSIMSIDVTTPGLGYQPIPATMSVSSPTGVGAVLRPLVDSTGRIVNIDIVSPGIGYTSADTVTATRAVAPNPAYVNAVFQIASVSLTGEIVSVSIINPGSGYQPSVTGVRIVSTLNPSVPYPTGTGFFGTVLTNGTGEITGVIVDNPGAGYGTNMPYLSITDPGSGAQTSVTLSGTSVASVSVVESGNGYTQSATGTVFNPSTAALPNPPATPAVVTVNVSQNTFGTNPNLYWQVWAGVTTNKQIRKQLDTVVSYFKSLGYTIQIQSNPDTGSTIQWKICW